MLFYSWLNAIKQKRKSRTNEQIGKQKPTPFKIAHQSIWLTKPWSGLKHFYMDEE